MSLNRMYMELGNKGSSTGEKDSKAFAKNQVDAQRSKYKARVAANRELEKSRAKQTPLQKLGNLNRSPESLMY